MLSQSCMKADMPSEILCSIVDDDDDDDDDDYIIAINIKAWFSSPDLFSRSSYSYLLTPPLGQDMTQGQFLSGV